MVDGIVQVTDINYDDILDATYEIVLMFCAPVFVDFSLISVVCRPM